MKGGDPHVSSQASLAARTVEQADPQHLKIFEIRMALG
jgi:hypothetical protein